MVGHILSLVTGYLIGSLSFTRIITKHLAPELKLDSIKVEDAQTGATYHRVPNATTASMAMGWQTGCLISLLDMAKVIVPVLFLRHFFPNQTYFLTAMIGGLLGNNWPIYYGFDGGSGLSVIYGGLLVIDPLAVLVTVSSGLLFGLIILRSMMLTFVLPMLLLIPWFWFRTGNHAYLYFALALNAGYFATFFKDVKEYLAKSPDGRISERAIMEQMPMGRGMLKMLDKLGLKKER